MTRAAIGFLLCFSLYAVAQTVQVIAGNPTRIPVQSVTAAYSLNADCAEVQADANSIIVIGRSPCSTYIAAVVAQGITDIHVLVLQRHTQVDTWRKAQLMAENVQESGSMATMYSSNPGELESSINVSRTEGGETTAVGFAVANGYAFSPQQRRTAIAEAYIRFSGPSKSITLLDEVVDQSPLTLQNADIRGVHIETNSWFIHAGISSLTSFREQLLENGPDRTVDAGYRIPITTQTTITPTIQWIGASRQFISGRSGVIGSLLYDYKNADRGTHLQLEGSESSGGMAGAVGLDILGEADRVQFEARSSPVDFPALAISPGRGFQADGMWTHSFSERLGFEMGGARDTYRLFGGGNQTNGNWVARLRYRVGHFTFFGGMTGAKLWQSTGSQIGSIAVPIGVTFDSRRFGNSFQYQYGKNSENDLGSNFVRDSVRLTMGRTTVTAYASRQTQAPTVDYLLVSLPWLRDALIAEGAVVSTPEEIQQFIRSHSDLFAAGLLGGLSVNLSPVRYQGGAALNWRIHRILSARFEWRWDDSQRVNAWMISTTQGGSLVLRLMNRTDLTVGGSLLKVRTPGFATQQPLVTVGVQRQLGRVPEIINRFQQHGWIRGIVFNDSQNHGYYDKSGTAMPGVLVVLDGIHETHTNASGLYSFGSLPPGKHLVEVRYSGGDAFLFTTPPQVEVEDNTVVNFGLRIRESQLFVTLRNDGDKPVAGVLVHVAGPTPFEAKTSESGKLSSDQLENGVYTITLDTDFIPPGYALDELKSQVLLVAPDNPGSAEFVLRALRSISGVITCQGSPVAAGQVQMDGTPVRAVQSGEYDIRNVTAGTHELIFTSGIHSLRRKLEVPGDPASLHVDAELCTATAGEIAR